MTETAKAETPPVTQKVVRTRSKPKEAKEKVAVQKETVAPAANPETKPETTPEGAGAGVKQDVAPVEQKTRRQEDMKFGTIRERSHHPDGFTTLRVGQDWLNRVGIGDVVRGISSHTGETYGYYAVTGVVTAGSLGEALQLSSRSNHICKAGGSISELEELIRRYHSTEQIAKAGVFPIITLNPISAEEFWGH